MGEAKNTAKLIMGVLWLFAAAWLLFSPEIVVSSNVVAGLVALALSRINFLEGKK